jgi:hypothetical protein
MLEDLIPEFIARVPAHPMDNEDQTIERVCVADSIEGCFLAHPDFRRVFCDNSSRRKQSEYDIGCPKYYECTASFKGKRYHGHFLRIYEFDINENDKVISNDELISKGLVPDAGTTGEAWILNNRKADRWYNILVLNVDEILFDHVIANDADYINLGHSMPDEIARRFSYNAKKSA